jgi:hypothetical protein
VTCRPKRSQESNLCLIACPSLEVLEVHSSGNGDERDQPHEIFFSGLQNGYADSLIVPGDWNRFSGTALVREESHCQVFAWLDGPLPLPSAIYSRVVGVRDL